MNYTVKPGRCGSIGLGRYTLGRWVFVDVTRGVFANRLKEGGRGRGEAKISFV